MTFCDRKQLRWEDIKIAEDVGIQEEWDRPDLRSIGRLDCGSVRQSQSSPMTHAQRSFPKNYAGRASLGTTVIGCSMSRARCLPKLPALHSIEGESARGVFYALFRPSPFPPHCTAMPASYPIDRSSCMSKDGPADPRFRIPGGVLQYNSKRDARFPYIYRISTHALVHSPDHIKTILIRVVDTSTEARIRCAEFDKTLSVPLGPNALMKEYGTLIDILLVTISNIIV